VFSEFGQRPRVAARLGGMRVAVSAEESVAVLAGSEAGAWVGSED
jgi:hypothetical protein